MIFDFNFMYFADNKFENYLLDNSKKFFERLGITEMEKRVEEMRSQLEEPFYLLVAGEYNSGKSKSSIALFSIFSKYLL